MNIRDPFKDLFLCGEDNPYLIYDAQDGDGNAGRQATAADLTADVVADYLDQDAENENNHRFVGTHQAIVSLMEDADIGIDKIDTVMIDLFYKGGLHGITKKD